MKRMAVLLAVLMLLLSACGGETAPETTQPTAAPAQAAAPAEEETAAAPTEAETTAATEPPVKPLYRLQAKMRYDENGELTHVTSYFYDDQNRLLGYVTTNAAGEWEGSREYTYYEDYREFSSEPYSFGGMTFQTSFREYLDEEGRERRIESYRNGELQTTETYNEQGMRQSMIGNTGVTVWEYDEHGNAVASLTGTDMDTLSKNMEHINTYDDQGRLSHRETKRYNGETGEFETTVFYEYQYEENKTTEILTYANETTSWVKGGTITTVTTYDDQGNVLREEIRDEASVGESLYVPVTEYTYEAVEVPG